MPMQNLLALVVDDSKVGRLTMMKKLEAMGLKVELAESGQQAFEYLARQRPDLIFMDHMMPEMDGFEVTRRLKALPATRDIPVIIISGNDEDTFIEEARAAGALDAIAKPPATEVLETLLASLPKASAQAPMPATAESAQVPVADMAELQALVERLLGKAMVPMREGLMAELEQRLSLASDNQCKSQAEWNAKLDQQAEVLVGLGNRLEALESLRDHVQSVEQRLLPLEVEASRPQPDFNALQVDINQRIAAGLTGQETRIDALVPQLESLHQAVHAVQTSAEQHAADANQSTAAWNSRLDAFMADLARVSLQLESVQSTQAEHQQHLEQRLAQVQEARIAPQPVAESALESMGEATNAQLQALQTELDGLRDCLSESRLQQLVAVSVANLPPAVETERVAVELPLVTVGESSNTELDQLKAKVKTLTLATAVGGALLLVAVGFAVFGG